MNMIAVDMIKQAFESNAAKPTINSKIMKKLAISKINTSLKVDSDWLLRDGINSIMTAKISDEEKADLISAFSKSTYDFYEDMKQEVEGLFGAKKQASVKADNKQSGEKEEIAKAPEGSSEEAPQDDPTDEKKTPAEHVIEQKPGKAMFDY